MKNLKNQKGITLVALIITIIVLIILAAVTIISVNNMGLVPLAINGTQNYAIAQENEGNLVNGITDLVLGAISNIENGGTGAGGSSSEEAEKLKTPQIKDNIEQKVEVNTIMYDEYNNQIVVPAGFKVVEHDKEENTTGVKYEYAVDEDGNPTHIPTVQDGIVIEDAEGADSGNQFVWIPTGIIKNKYNTTTEIKLGRYDFYEKTEVTAKDAITDGSIAILDFFIEETPEEHTSSGKENAIANNITTFYNSATGKGGYYIARYEASYDGKGDKPLSQPSKETMGTLAGTQNAPSGSEKKGYLWNNITQSEASKASQAMYSGEGKDYESDLVNSYAWDTAIVFIQAYSRNKTYSQQNALNYQEGKQEPDNTGERGKTTDKVCNIYDMASNCWEWTTETSTYDSIPCVRRGATYDGGGNCPIFRNYRYGTTDVSNNDSFRPCLYLTK